MNSLFDRIIILIMTLIFCMGFMGSELIYVALALLIYAGLCFFFMDSRIHHWITGVMCILMLTVDILFPVMAIVIYESFYQIYKKKYYECFFTGITVIMYIILYISGTRTYIEELAVMPTYQALLGGGIIILAVYLAYYSYHYVELNKRFLRERDDNQEFRLLTIQKNQLMRQQQDSEISMATLRERNRIAREIHDNVGHLLSRSILQTGALMAVYKGSPIESGLKDVSDTLNESMNSIRESVHDLHNDSLDLKKAVDDIIEKNSEYNIKLDYDISEHVPRTVKYCFISIINEAFENIKKHSDADKVMVAIFEHPAFYQLIIQDNGHPGPVKESGIGLHNMKSRVEELGGNIVFTSEQGFRIFLVVPKKEDKE